MRLRPYFQLVRLPNLFTAAADSLAGWLLATGSFREPGRWLPLMGASAAIYAAGIALNDLLDYEIDRMERPGRPLPSGAVSRRFAASLAVGLLVLGLALAFVSSPRAALVAAALIGCVVGYDAGLKRTALGPELMGACRGLNLLLGLSAAPNFGGITAWLAAGGLAVFVVGITWISRSEVAGGRSAGLWAGAGLQFLGWIGLVMTAGIARRFPVEGVSVLVVAGLIVFTASGRALAGPRPATIQRAVKTGVLSLVWLDVGLVAAVRGPGTALAVAALWVPAFVLGKWLYST